MNRPRKEARLLPKVHDDDWRLPPCVVYVPLNVLEDLDHKLEWDRRALRRADALGVLPDKAARDTKMVPIFVDMLTTCHLFEKLRYYVCAFDYFQWPWLVKRLVRECGKLNVIRMIIAARRCYRKMEERFSLPTISAEQWVHMLPRIFL